METIEPEAAPATATAPEEQSKSKWKSAWEEVSYHAGGLLSISVDSTRHYSIVRHSHGLVYYKGPATWIAISTFSDKPLPADRTYWLQSRGWSGKTGTRIAASFMGFGRNWIEVTPSTQITSQQLDQTDERVWTRDIKKFAKKNSHGKKHLVRETAILRIPCSALDGYFRVLLVDGSSGNRKVLCPSPAFRIASTSSAPASIRGASLSTLPLELGIKTLSLITTETAGTFVEPVATPLTEYMSNNGVADYASTAQTVGQPIYDLSGAADKVDSANEAYDQAREASFQRAGGAEHTAADRPFVIGDDSGPEAPYPIRLNGKIVQGSGQSTSRWRIPTANLASLHDADLHRLSGIYCAWACVQPTKQTSEDKAKLPDTLFDWHRSLVTVFVPPETRPSVMPKKEVHVHLIKEFEEVSLLGNKLSVVIMGYLRPWATPPPAQSMDNKDELYRQQVDRYFSDKVFDIKVTQNSLDRPCWGMDEIMRRHKSRTISDKYVDSRQAASRQMERIPTHRLGVRTDALERRETNADKGGLFVPRQS